MEGQKHAYLILAHACPGQLRKLLMLLDDPRNDIFVHLDAKADFSPAGFDGCCRDSALCWIEPRIRVAWAGYSMIEAILAMVRAAVPGKYAYYHLLSGMDLPVKDQDTIHAFFDRHQGEEFLDLWNEAPHTHTRYHYKALFPEGAAHPLQNLANNIYKGLQMAFGRQINRDTKFYFASTWFSLTNDCVEYILAQEAWIEKTFMGTNSTDEIFIPTVVMNSPFKDHLYAGEGIRNLRFIDWSRGESVRHPWTFRAGDWDLLMSTPYFWARKFDERVDADIIDRLYDHLRTR
ncbi:MAG: beta-1,6-N-acetylglucosaminyltransferase [Bacteroidales bacterium]|nr:beta-1,6-N-acetylglucosaminyltransferase [Bacteroidales bacterium]